MAKPERGLPKSFDIKVPDGPVRLGDYLDESPGATTAPIPAAEVFVAQAPPPPPEPAPAPVPAPVYVPPPPAVAFRQTPAPLNLRRSSPPRKQFNMAPETLRMLDELLAHIRNYSAERDVRASEVVHALVLAVHEVRPFLDLTEVPPRGKWGSASAATLPVALKEAFQKAVAKSRGR